MKSDVQWEIQQRLSLEWIKLKARNPAYSLRAFSKRLGVSSSALSEILAGKRRVSAKLAERLLSNIGLSPDESRKVISLFPSKKIDPSQKKQQAEWIRLTADQYKVVSDWWHFAILSLAETDEFVSRDDWIAKRLGIPQRDARSAIERLLRLEMLERDSDGRLKTTGVQFTTTDEVFSASLRKVHVQNLELAQKSIEQDDLNERDFTAVTMAINPENLPLAKKRIRDFRDRLCRELEGDRKKEVYKMCIQLFPLSRAPKTKERKHGNQ